ncbi:hypothetical protein G3M55_81160 [Streptomyces sp. SID8455]|nr:hypothetical protein [Streptomyces sp. SID8455]
MGARRAARRVQAAVGRWAGPLTAPLLVTTSAVAALFLTVDGTREPRQNREHRASRALLDHLEGKAGQILGRLRDGHSLDHLSAVYEVPEPHLRARVADRRQRHPARSPVRTSSATAPFGPSGRPRARWPPAESAVTRWPAREAVRVAQPSAVSARASAGGAG